MNKLELLKEDEIVLSFKEPHIALISDILKTYVNGGKITKTTIKPKKEGNVPYITYFIDKAKRGVEIKPYRKQVNIYMLDDNDNKVVLCEVYLKGSTSICTRGKYLNSVKLNKGLFNFIKSSIESGGYRPKWDMKMVFKPTPMQVIDFIKALMVMDYDYNNHMLDNNLYILDSTKAISKVALDKAVAVVVDDNDDEGEGE